MNRRKFLTDLSIALALLFGVFLALFNGVRFVLPAIKKKELRRVLLATPEDFKGLTSIVIDGVLGNKIILINKAGTYRAFSAKCTHLGCTVLWTEESQTFFCPCHDGYFGKDGEIKSGPLPRPLDEFKIEVVGQSIFVYVEERGQVA